MRLRLDIARYGWTVDVFLAVQPRHALAVEKALTDIGCDDGYLQQARTLLQAGELDRGLTYSNIAERRSVVVVGQSSSASEFVNSLTHELHHLVAHVCEGVGVDLASEEACYLAGGLSALVYEAVPSLFCERCRDARRRFARRFGA